MEAPSTTSRRHVLGLAGTVLAGSTAGCSYFGGEDSTEIILHSALREEVTVLVSVVHPERGAIIGAKVVGPEPGEKILISDEITNANGSNVGVDLEGGGTFDFEWELVDEPLHVIVHQEEVVFTVEPQENEGSIFP